MIFSDCTIEGAIQSGKIGVEPLPTSEQFQPASLDVRLGTELYDVKQDIRGEMEDHILLPGRRYLAHTKEEIDLPNDVAAQLAGRSSVGRKGIIVHKTAGWIDPGFTGQITLELMNLGDSSVKLETGERIAQLVFFPLDYPSSGYDGGYQDQTGATEAYND